MKSKLFKIDFKDILKGAFLAMLTAIATALITIIEQETVMALLDWTTLKPVLVSGVGVFVLYLLKNLVTNSEDKILKAEKKK